jgi:hypothetical protein
MIKEFDDLSLEELVAASGAIGRVMMAARISVHVGELGQGMDGFRYVCLECRHAILGREGRDETGHGHGCALPLLREAHLTLALRIDRVREADLQVRAARGEEAALKELRLRAQAAEREAKKGPAVGAAGPDEEGG